MSVQRTIAVLAALVLACNGQVRGDPTPGPWAEGLAGAAVRPVVVVREQADFTDNPALLLILYPQRECGLEIPAAVGSRAERGEEEAAIKCLPAAPGSASLFLCAVGTLGAVQVSRSARRLHVGEVSSWLHTCGVGPVGTAEACNPFEVYLAPVPAMLAAGPVWTCRTWYVQAADLPGEADDLLVRIQRSPRGPPSGR